MKQFSTIIFLFLLLISSLKAGAATYYVSTSGLDTNNGTSTETPWRHAPGQDNVSGVPAGVTLVADDILLFKKGDTWTDERLSIQNATAGGSAGHPVTFSSYGSGARPKFVRTGLAKVYIWRIEGDVDHVHISGIDFTGPAVDGGCNTGLRVANVLTAKPDNIHVDDCYFYGFELSGVMFYAAGSNSSVTNSYYYDTANGIYLAESVGDAYLISQNTFVNINYTEKYGSTRDGHAVGIQNSDNHVIRNNLIVNAIDPIAIWTSNSAIRSTIFGNVIYGSKKAFTGAEEGKGITISGAATDDDCYGNIVYRNVIDTVNWGLASQYEDGKANYFYNNTVNDPAYGIRQRRSSNYQVFKNNIFYSSDTYHVWQEDTTVGTSNVFDYNDYYTNTVDFLYRGSIKTDLATWQTASSQDSHAIGSDPLFVANSTGAHDGANNATTLTDSGESWTVNGFANKAIYNSTDGSWGRVVSNTATTLTATLVGGTDNDWDTGDNYTIYNFEIQAGSPCIDAGSPLTTITSVTEEVGGTSFTVADAGYFHDGFGCADINGDVQIGQAIRLYDATNGHQDARITEVDYDTNTITVSVNKLWVQNVTTVSLNYAGEFSDIGRFEKSNPPQHTNPLVTVTPYNSTVDSGSSVTYGATITYFDGAVGDTYTWDYGGQDEAVAALSTIVEDPGTVNPTTETGAFSQSFTVVDNLGGSTTVNWTLTVQAVDPYEDVIAFSRLAVDPFNSYFDYVDSDLQSNPTFADEAVIHADAAYGGAAAGLKIVDTNSTRDHMSLAHGVGIAGGEGNTALVFKILTWANTSDIFMSSNGAADYVRISLVNDNELVAVVTDGVNTATMTTTAADLALNTWYRAKVTWNATSNSHGLYVYNDSEVLLDSDTDSTDIDALATMIYTWIGNRSEAAFNACYIGRWIHSTEPTDPTQNWLDEEKWMKGRWIESVTQVSPNGNYGEDDTITCILNINPLSDGGTVEDTDAGEDNDMTLSSTLDAGGPLSWSADSAVGVALYHHQFTATVGAGQTEDKLTITSISDGDDTANFDLTTIPSGSNLADSASIAIDTTGLTIIDRYLCDCTSPYAKISDATEYTSDCFCRRYDLSEVAQFSGGPLSNIAPVIDATYGTDPVGSVIVGLDGSLDYMVVQFCPENGVRGANVSETNADLPHGTTMIVDISPAENEASSYTYAADSGGALTLSYPFLSSVPATIGAGKTFANKAALDTAGGAVPGDNIKVYTVAESQTWSVSGTESSPIVLEFVGDITALTISGDRYNVYNSGIHAGSRTDSGNNNNWYKKVPSGVLGMSPGFGLGIRKTMDDSP